MNEVLMQDLIQKYQAVLATENQKFQNDCSEKVARPKHIDCGV